MKYMLISDKKIDFLIEAGWGALESDFRVTEFEEWRNAALQCLSVLCGPDHTYTVYFRSRICGDGLQNILACLGILEAARRHYGNSSDT